jgi:hypothetical protein
MTLIDFCEKGIDLAYYVVELDLLLKKEGFLYKVQ